MVAQAPPNVIESRSTPAITIVGAGPAGLICAIALARAGRPTIIFEARQNVGERFHDDFQGLENWSSDKDVIDEIRQFGVKPTFEHHPIYTGIVFDAWGTPYEISDRKPLYYLVRRGPGIGTLDHALLEQARSVGVDVRFGERVKLAQGNMVLAGGPRSADAIAAGYVFDTDMPDGNWACFDNKLAPLGYAYLLVHKNRGTVASCMFTGFKQEAEYVARTVSTFKERVGLSMRNERKFGGYANFHLPRTAVQGGHFVIGEQAGFQDALAGFGMRYALRSGLLAARSFIENRDYSNLWREGLLPGLKTSISNRYLFNMIGERGWRLALARLEGKDARETLKSLYGERWSTRLLFPIAHWRYRAPLRDRSCDHKQCDCVWCRCAAEEAQMAVT